MVADAAQDFQSQRQKADVEVRLAQLDVAKVSRALLNGTRTSHTAKTLFGGAKPAVEEASLLDRAVLGRDGELHLRDRHGTLQKRIRKRLGEGGRAPPPPHTISSGLRTPN
jgi:hypothetical protein